MSDDASARLTLPYLAGGQLQKHVTLNEALTRLDALVQAAVVSRSVGEQPEPPGDGALYILPGGAAGAGWAGQPAGTLMRAEAGSWSAVAPPEGCVVVVLDEGRLIVRHDGGWRDLGSMMGAVQGLSRLGLDATADADNPFAARLNKALWTSRDGDLRMTLNKAAAGDVLSLLFQSGFSGRAELGLIGDDDLTLKVSEDGSGWTEAARIDRSTGRISLTLGALRSETTVLTADAVWSPPVWARRVEAVCVAGGGGGGGGLAGAAGSSRYGGGGGGSGGVSSGVWPAASLAAGLGVVVGAGGAGGPAGLDGETGADTTIHLDGEPLLRAGGGEGGLGGSAASGPGGSGGASLDGSNAGGSSSLTGAGGRGGSTDGPGAPGGGGAGGALDASDTARAGGPGGEGAVLGRVAAGGAAGDDGADATALSAPGGGGGGGTASAAGTGQSGGDGGSHGGGGGGGGAGLTGGGAGGAGGAGLVWLTAIG